jgi:hypothetical protein
MAGATSSIGAIAQLGKTQQAHSLFKHDKKGAKAGHAMGNQQQFASLLAGKQAALQNSAVGGKNGSPTASSAPSTAASNASPGQSGQESSLNALLAG